jgi:hypothetical protein
MHKVKIRCILNIDSIVDVQSVVVLYIYRGGGLDPLQSVPRANSTVLVNKSRKKLETLTNSARVWTVRAGTSMDCSDRGSSGLRAGSSAACSSAQH